MNSYTPVPGFSLRSMRSFAVNPSHRIIQIFFSRKFPALPPQSSSDPPDGFLHKALPDTNPHRFPTRPHQSTPAPFQTAFGLSAPQKPRSPNKASYQTDVSRRYQTKAQPDNQAAPQHSGQSDSSYFNGSMLNGRFPFVASSQSASNSS